MIAFITCNNILVPLLEGLCSSNPCRFEFSIFLSSCWKVAVALASSVWGRARCWKAPVQSRAAMRSPCARGHLADPR